MKNLFKNVKTPLYVCELEKLEQNLKLLKKIKDKTDVKILLALKAFSMHSTFKLVKKYLDGATASGLWEAKLGKKLGKVHTYSPAFKKEDIKEVVSISSHVVFNSFNQLRSYKKQSLNKTSIGLRLNLEVSFSPKEMYNPCGQYSRLGIKAQDFYDEVSHDKSLLKAVEGFHFHALCEMGADELEICLNEFVKKFSKYFDKLKWVNFGGGHHITKKGYDVEKLIKLLKNFKQSFPHLEVFLEPGEAVGWQSGFLASKVVDIVKNEKNIAILDTSFEAHMPDCILMPYRPKVRNEVKKSDFAYILSGNTCLAGDFMGDFYFKEPLKIGDIIIFEDMIHYTIVKNTSFNGIKLPSLALLKDKKLKVIKNFKFDDFKRRN